jgi:Iron-containing alcohol dehydrogenase
MVNAFAFSDILGKPSGTPCFGRNGAPDKWCSRSWSGGYGTLLEHGLAARLAVERQAVTPAVEKVVEANTLLSGLGFESGGLGAAHPIHNGLTALEGTHHYWHGEKVAFGIIAMIMLEERRAEVLAEVVDFCLEVGLPVTLEDIGLEGVSREDLPKVAEAACIDGETIHNMPFEVHPPMLVDAMLAADAYGQQRRDLWPAKRRCRRWRTRTVVGAVREPPPRSCVQAAPLSFRFVSSTSMPERRRRFSPKILRFAPSVSCG